jgi:hypothetical protein
VHGPSSDGVAEQASDGAAKRNPKIRHGVPRRFRELAEVISPICFERDAGGYGRPHSRESMLQHGCAVILARNFAIHHKIQRYAAKIG